MLVDFHIHTTASDGALPPAELLERAAALGIAEMAITDHDTMRGYAAVADQVPPGVRLHPGVELSCVWGGCNIHIVGIGIDPGHAAINTILDELDEARQARAVTIGERLEKAGMPGALAGALAVAGDSQIGRPHFATWMVDSGHVADHNEAFDRWLGRGKRGDVKAYWPSLESVVGAVVTAGGKGVLAHPLKYGLTGMKLQALTTAFVAAGGSAIEILSGRQTDDEVARLRRLANEHGLSVSVGSDFHRDWQYGPTLGVEARVARDAPALWEQLS